MESQHGRIQLYLGPMYGGKTTELIAALHRYAIQRYRVCYINNVLDSRGEEFSTHNKLLDSGSLTSHRIDTYKRSAFLKSDYDTFVQYDVIGIDEAQFYDATIVDFCLEMRKREKIIVVAGLTSNFKQQQFGHLFTLLIHASSVVLVKAVCHICSKRTKNEAIYTLRISDEEEEVVIGSGDKYVSCCVSCYDRMQK